ncbi:universal stress protein [Oxalobacteraceae bacterium R-40]|uniref:Universal stress protein n=1 Tax=Keguizhuia sedimenti TaxID=3064264 RepID=A0ABU1BR30_9BURK|nr:universal stress protein [Oxalobacteraceae bacterium R-40]
MNYTSIAVHVDSSRHMADRVGFACAVANTHNAHLIGLATTGIAEAASMAGISGEGGAFIGSYLDTCKERTTANLEEFENIARKSNVASFEKRTLDEETGYALCLQARYSDLIIAGQTDPDEHVFMEQSGIPEYVVTHSGRPVLLVPYALENPQLNYEKACIAWDGGLPAARAAYGAIPLLRHFKKVEVVIFNPATGFHAHGEEPGADIAHYLSRHGLHVDVTRHSTGNAVDVGSALLSQAADTGAGLIVMGAYGHSKLRELVLGGVTRTILKSMTVPVLMSH